METEGLWIVLQGLLQIMYVRTYVLHFNLKKSC